MIYMKTNIYRLNIIILGLIIIGTLSSCDKFMDVVPKGKVIPTKTSDYDGMMVDPSLSSATYPLSDLCTDNVMAPDEIINSILSGSSGKAYFWMEDFYTMAEDDPSWSKPYSAIYTCNVVDEYTPTSTEGDEHFKSKVMAEAQINRAYYYWYLSSLYSGAYDESKLNEILSVPLILKPDLEIKATRTSLSEVSSQIIKDLENVAEKLPLEGDTKYRVTRASAFALAARIYLYYGNYEKASSNAQKAIEIKGNLEDMRLWSFKNPTKPSQGINNKPYPIDSKESLLYRSTGFTTILTSYAISKDLEDLYLTNPKDLRYKYYFSDIMRNGQKYEDGKKRYLQELDYSISVPEMMLIIAEDYARKGDQKALQIVNDLRKYRFLEEDYVPLDANGKDELLSVVLNERRLELVMRGLRWFDMKRLAKEGLFTTTVTRMLNGTEVKLEPNSNRYVFPISKKLMSINPNILPNPR